MSVQNFRSTVPESPALIFELSHGQVAGTRERVGALHNRIHEVMNLSAIDDPQSQTLHAPSNRRDLTLVRLWPMDPDKEVAQIIRTAYSFEDRATQLATSHNFLLFMGTGPVRLTAAASEAIVFNQLEPATVSGDADMIWFQGNSGRLKVIPGDGAPAYPANAETDIDSFLAAKLAVDALAEILDPLGSASVCKDFIFSSSLAS